MKTAALVVTVTLASLFSLTALGVVTLPLPAPAQGHYAHKLPPGVYDWQPRQLKGEWALNEHLLKAVRLFEGQIHGSESVAIGLEGELVMLDRTNAVWEATPDGAGGYTLQPQPVVQLGAGRPLGYHFDAEGHLVVADSLKGLLRYNYYDSQSKDITLLASHVSASSPTDPGSPITYANDLAIASDGSIYFTSCTDIVPQLNQQGFYDTYRAWFLSLMRGQPKGRLLRYDPNTKETHVLATGFYYANGVALSADESFLVLVETDRIRAHKVWLKGPKM
ncbi:hypothetical protein OEZ85_004109 [Tetradesmus obliquus]|uniref:Strictosidine synthase conserved region domain-containing protein n=1 Tax=Tetradesmus obliquus TaxID=3088 RepID=A0ABY8UDD9_TETOB|nr:hypothetical protein OEZ85_004109 [Tetradesmus obliquus]